MNSVISNNIKNETPVLLPIHISGAIKEMMTPKYILTKFVLKSHTARRWESCNCCDYDCLCENDWLRGRGRWIEKEIIDDYIDKWEWYEGVNPSLAVTLPKVAFDFQKIIQQPEGVCFDLDEWMRKQEAKNV